MSSVTGGILPSARVISNVVHGSGVCDLLEPKDSAMVMQWGQLLDHDFAHTPTLKGNNFFFCSNNSVTKVCAFCLFTVSTRHLRVEVYPKLLISQSKFFGPRKLTSRYKKFEIKRV